MGGILLGSGAVVIVVVMMLDVAYTERRDEEMPLWRKALLVLGASLCGLGLGQLLAL